MQHRIIMFAASSPGAGKSTLSSYLFRQLSAQHIPAQWLHEEEFVYLPAFTPFLHDLAASYPKIDLLLSAVAALPSMYHDQVIITDSFVPGYHLLFGVHARQHIEQYNNDLYHTCHPLNPLLIYLKADIATAYERAVQQRGEVWLERMIHRMNSWQLPLYEQKPFRNLDDVILFEQQIDELSQFLLSRWPGRSLTLDTTSVPLPHLQTVLLNDLKLDESCIEHYVPPELLTQYAGTYVMQDNRTQVQTLEITLMNDTLFINTYWPNGTPLRAETNTRFRLEAINRWIDFDVQDDTTVYGLTYCMNKQQHRYTKIAA